MSFWALYHVMHLNWEWVASKMLALLAWHTLFDELSISPETVGAHRRAPNFTVKSIPQF